MFKTYERILANKMIKKINGKLAEELLKIQSR
jgi:hypothetical protein